MIFHIYIYSTYALYIIFTICCTDYYVMPHTIRFTSVYHLVDMLTASLIETNDQHAAVSKNTTIVPHWINLTYVSESMQIYNKKNGKYLEREWGEIIQNIVEQHVDDNENKRKNKMKDKHSSSSISTSTTWSSTDDDDHHYSIKLDGITSSSLNGPLAKHYNVELNAGCYGSQETSKQQQHNSNKKVSKGIKWSLDINTLD